MEMINTKPSLIEFWNEYSCIIKFICSNKFIQSTDLNFKSEELFYKYEEDP